MKKEASKLQIIFIVALVSFITGVFFVYAQGPISPNPGHLGNQIGINIGSQSFTLQDAINQGLLHRDTWNFQFQTLTLNTWNTLDTSNTGVISWLNKNIEVVCDNESPLMNSAGQNNYVQVFSGETNNLGIQIYSHNYFRLTSTPRIVYSITQGTNSQQLFMRTIGGQIEYMTSTTGGFQYTTWECYIRKLD